MTNQDVVLRDEGLPVGLYNAVALWADGSTDPASPRRREFRKAKGRVVMDFFTYVNLGPAQVEPEHIKAWQLWLEGQGLTPATIYAKVSRVSSFFTWAQENGQLDVRDNPVNAARPKAPKPYTSDRAKSLSDEEVDSLLAHIQARGDIIGLRDYALLLFYLTTGWRRSEVIRLRWGDIRVNDGLICNVKVKGGTVETRAVESIALRDAVLAYLAASGRLDTMEPDSPLWTRHDKSGQPGKALSGHAFAKNLKAYATRVGIDYIHLHQTRHTLARWAGEELGSMTDVQHVLGHKSLATTKAYLPKVGVKADKIGKRIEQRLGLNG